ncbi:MAG TPA: methyl-accepting chemotaxis protein [Microvirga sp.]|nr:methyl-accepting chemotaxis protein [Microvirga sp.]
MRSLRAKFISITGLMLLVGLGAGVGSMWGNAVLTDSISRNLVLAQATRNQGSADMMHDALRGDVYRALHAARVEPTLRPQIEADLKDHLAQLRRNVDENRGLALNDHIRAALGELEAPLAAYAKAASHLVETAFESTKEAERALPDFVQRFEVLEDAMAAVSDRIGQAAEQVEQEASVLASMTRWMNAAGAMLSILITMGLCLYLLRSVLRPISSMTETMKALADGNTDVDVTGGRRSDEIGRMARAVEVFRDNAREMTRLRAEQEETRARAELQRRHDLISLADQVEASLRQVAGAVSMAAEKTASAAQTVSNSVQSTNDQASAVAAASHQAASNVQTVATATEELSASFAEVAEHVARAGAVTRRATDVAQRTNATVEELTAAAEKIEEVVQLISTVAAQTNLLALNAAIEAARAGEAGRGFAVVAQEVKELAGQTAKATEIIAAQISAMQATTSQAVAAIHEIGRTVQDIDTISGAIAAAVEEQQAATRDIAQNVQQAALGTQEVSENIEGVSRAALNSSSAAAASLDASDVLRAQAATLIDSLDQFLGRLRAA